MHDRGLYDCTTVHRALHTYTVAGAVSSSLAETGTGVHRLGHRTGVIAFTGRHALLQCAAPMRARPLPYEHCQRARGELADAQIPSSVGPQLR